MEDLSTISSTDLQRVKMSQQNENIQVYVRVRPMNNLERTKSSLQVLDCPGSKEVVVKERASSIHNLTKTFTFDRVFSPKSKQIEVYKAVVAPLLEEVLLGYNCTVFAYGQTGTGKTFTMEGERSNDPDLSWENDPMTGIVPRALSQLFDELRLQNVEFTVRVSLLELYNEELFDLLSPTDDLKMKQLRLFEDSNRKGSVIIQGLEEVTVHNKHEVYNIMERGTEKRRTAATQMNATSSRSHTVFTVTVHIKESNIDGEELIKIGKLHLVDLAGSENIGRSGAVDKRAREAGSINQSLLTLGRVITALVERTPHIPYRESKLTRLLQDSLGGRTKTSIIATVSPASYNLEETLSTLDYAHRAKNIMNRPEINQRLTKKAVMKEFTEEIERLRRDLVATREKNGVYLDKENYDHIMSQLEAQGHDLCEKITQTRSLQDTLDKKEEELALVKAQLEETKDDLNTANQVLNETRARAERLQQELVKTAMERDQQEHLVESHVKTEKNLSKEAEVLLQTTEETTSNLDKLYRKLDRKKYVETCNLESGRRFKADLSEQFSSMCSSLKTFRLEHATFCGEQRMKLDEFLQKKETQMASLSNMFTNFMQELNDYAHNSNALVTEEADVSKLQLDDLKVCFDEHREAAADNLELSKEQLIKYFNILYDKFDDINGKLESLASGYGSDMDSQELILSKFVECSVMKMEKARQDIELHIETKLAHYMALQEEFTVYRETNNKYVEELKTEAKGMITEMEKWIKNANEYETKAEQKSEVLLKNVEEGYDRDAAFLKRMANEWDIHKVEAEFLRRGYGDHKNSKRAIRKKDVKEVEDTIENAANTAKFLRGASLEGLTIHLNHLNVMQNAVAQKIDERLLRGIEFANKYFTASKAIVESTDKTTKSINSGVEAAYDSDMSHVEDDKKQMETHCNQFSGWSEEVRAGILQQSGKLGEFWESTYLTDLPSGQTPQKKSYVYPRNLSATSPHETILERFGRARRDEEKNEIF